MYTSDISFIKKIFSTSGNILSAKRECIKPETLKILVFIKENYSQVKANIKHWVKNCGDECWFNSTERGFDEHAIYTH